LIDHELRFQAGRRLGRQMVRDGRLGTIGHVKAAFHSGNRADTATPWNWWSDVEAGGGALGAIGSHIIDSLHWLLDTDIASVFCQLRTAVKERLDRAGTARPVTTDDECNMLLRFADTELVKDATGLVSISMAEKPGYSNRIDIFGTKGALRIDILGEVSFSGPGEPDWRQVEVDLGRSLPGMPDNGFSRGFVAFAPYIVDAVRSGSDMITGAATFEEGLRIQRVLDAARESDRNRCAVDMC
jgi:predicted dehydrogenase